MNNFFNKLVGKFMKSSMNTAKKEFKATVNGAKANATNSNSWMNPANVTKKRMSRDEALKIFNYEPNVKITRERLDEVA